ncbi:hypothetical protein [Streptomyces sp. NPDC054975]
MVPYDPAAARTEPSGEKATVVVSSGMPGIPLDRPCEAVRRRLAELLDLIVKR